MILEKQNSKLIVGSVTGKDGMLLFLCDFFTKHSSNRELWKGRDRLEVCSSEVEDGEGGGRPSISREVHFLDGSLGSIGAP